MFSKPKDATQPQATAAASKPESAVAATTPDPHGSMPLGLEGYCAVSLAEKGQWVEGRAQWGARHRGRTYLFAGAEQQQAFLANPDRYAPALSGDDPVLACDAGKQIAGQRRYGVTYQARTYLFSSPETRTAFAANPQRYTSRVKMAEAVPPTGTILK
jgi:YHS domain-containing protein